jgi:hypothetical protein
MSGLPGGLAGLGFAQPVLLTALLALPALWWLLRLIPPPPRRAVLPTIVLLGEAPDRVADERPPWWLMLLRLMLAALIILACAGPVLRPTVAPPPGPLVLVLDNGWASAARWPAVQEAARTAIAARAADDRRVLIVTTAPPAGGWPAVLPRPEALTPALAQARIAALAPQPWPTDRAGLVQRLTSQLPTPAELLWITDGLEDGGSGALARLLQRHGPVELAQAGAPPVAIRKVAPTPQGWSVELIQPAGSGARAVALVARDRSGRIVGEATATFEPGQRATQITLPVAPQERPLTTLLMSPTDPGPATVALLDASTTRPLVGIVTGEAAADRQPLRSGQFYVRRSLEPRTELLEGTVEQVLDGGAGLLVLIDGAGLSEETQRRLLGWIEGGGVLLQFAGPRTAESGVPLSPVPLRLASRAFGGTLSWGEPLTLAPFADTSPFAGLSVPADVTVSRQVLADPSPQLAARTWAELSDGTPLVTAGAMGQGLSILVHTTASPDWTDLPLSGLFEAMLGRLLPLVGRARAGVQAAPTGPLLLTQALDGAGGLTVPTGVPPRIAAAAFDQARASPTTPPGLYGTGAAVRALNLAGSLGPIGPTTTLARFDTPPGVRAAQDRAAPVDLRPPLLLLAALLFVADMLLSLWLRGLLPRWRALVPAAATALAVVLLSPAALAAEGARTVRLAYVPGGNPAAEAGLTTLTRLVALRTAVRMGPPVAVDPARDDLGLYPVLYWPIPANPAPLPARAVSAVSAYLANGGFILFDAARAGATPVERARASRQLLGALGLPRLEPMPDGHVLAKSFYLLRGAPGAAGADPLWVEADTAGDNGRVSAVAFGANDWAGAWAGGAGSTMDPRSRELALRFGINLVVYALTGTYKADQVHAAALIQRISRQRRQQPGLTPVPQ